MSSKAECSLRGSSLAEENPISFRLPPLDRAIREDALHVDRAAPVLLGYRCDRRGARPPAKYVPVRFVSRSTPASAPSIARRRCARPPDDASPPLLWLAVHAASAAAVRVPCRGLLPRAFD